MQWKVVEQCPQKVPRNRMLEDKTVCTSLDGWSNEPVICATVTTSEPEIFLVDIVDTSGNAHTADYLKSRSHFNRY